MIRDIENRIGIVKAISIRMVDDRRQSYVRHRFEEITLQRVCQIVAGYEDANDCDKLRDDTMITKVTCSQTECHATVFMPISPGCSCIQPPVF